MNFQQESWILDKVKSVLAAYAEEEGTEREILQVPEDDIHKAAKESNSLPGQLHSYCHSSCKLHLKREYSVLSSIISIGCFIQGRTGV